MIRFPISQTEYNCPAQQNHDPMRDVLLWLIQGTIACLLVLTGALLWVLLL